MTNRIRTIVVMLVAMGLCVTATTAIAVIWNVEAVNYIGWV
jgi:hypothetical protein